MMNVCGGCHIDLDMFDCECDQRDESLYVKEPLVDCPVCLKDCQLVEHMNIEPKIRIGKGSVKKINAVKVFVDDSVADTFDYMFKK